MAASYPGTVKTYTDKVDGTSIVLAADINSVQAEVNAIETELGANAKTSLIPASVGTYNAAGVSTSLSARVGNLEAGLTANATDGTRVGYTQIGNTQSITTSGGTGSTTFSSIPGSYQKLVLVVACTSYTTGTPTVSFTINGLGTAYSVTSFVYGTATPSTSTNASAATMFAVSGTTSVANVEFPMYSTSYGGKVWTTLASDRSQNGYIATGAITTIAVSVGAGNMVISCSLYGVK